MYTLGNFFLVCPEHSSTMQLTLFSLLREMLKTKWSMVLLRMNIWTAILKSYDALTEQTALVIPGTGKEKSTICEEHPWNSFLQELITTNSMHIGAVFMAAFFF